MRPFGDTWWTVSRARFGHTPGDRHEPQSGNHARARKRVECLSLGPLRVHLGRRCAKQHGDHAVPARVTTDHTAFTVDDHLLPPGRCAAFATGSYARPPTFSCRCLRC